MLNPTLSQSAARRSSEVSRRDLLKGLTAGLGGAMVSPLFSQRASGASVTPVLSSTPAILLSGNLASGNQVTATGLASYGPGWIFVLTQNTSGTTTTYDLEFVDVHSLSTVFSFINYYNQSLPTTPFLKPVVDDTFVYTANGSTAYAIPLAMPMTYAASFSLSSAAVGNLVLAGTTLLVATSDGALHAYVAKTRTRLWSITPAGAPPISSFTVAGSLIYVSANGQLSAYNLADGSQVFSASAASGKVTAVGDSVFITATDGVHSYSLPGDSSSSWVVNWSYSFSGSATLPAAPYNGFLYAVDSSGQLHEIQPGRTQGQANRPPLPLSPDIDQSQPLVFEDQVVYGASPGGTSNLTIYPMVLASGSVSAYPTNVPGRFLGIENGTCFFTHSNGGSVAGVALNPQVNGFYAESELMADTYPGGTVKAQGTSFRTNVRLQDANNNPRTNKAVKIWANEPVTLNIDSTVPGGSPIQVALTGGPNSAYWATTDNAGEISIICVASNVTCPAIFMWGSFMYQVNGEYMVLYPDQPALAQLSIKSASDLTNGTAYDNSSVLQSQYQGSASLIATHIQNTLGGVASTSTSAAPASLALALASPAANRHRKPLTAQIDPNKYVAYPSSTSNSYLSSRANYSQNVTDTYRPFGPAQVAYCLNFGSSCPSGVASAEVGSFLGSFKDLVDNVVVKAIQKVEQIAVSVENDIVTHVIAVAEGFYKFAVQTVEAAAASVSALLATVASDIKQAVEWISYVLDWQSFLDTQQQIVTLITQRMTNYTTWITQIDATTIAQIHTTFTNLEGQVKGDIDNFISQFGGSALQSQQPSGNDPQAAYGAKGAKSYVQSKWLTSKVQANVGQTTPAASVTASFDDPAADIFGAFTQLADNIRKALAESQFIHIPDDLKTIFESLQLLWQDPTQFATKSFASILGTLRDLVIGFLQLADAVIENLIAAIPTILTGLFKLVTSEIHIPVISDLFSAINAAPLTMLNLIALVAAIPATIVSRAAGALSVGVAPLNKIILGSIVGFCGLFYAILDSVSDNQSLPNAGPVAYASAAASALGFLVSTPLDNKPTDIFGYLFYIAQSCSLVLTGVTIAITLEASFLVSEAWGNVTLPSVNFFYGCTMVPWSLMMGLQYPSTFGGLTMFSNIFGYLPYLGKQLATGPKFTLETPQRIVPTIIDALGDTTSAILNIVNAIDG